MHQNALLPMRLLFMLFAVSFVILAADQAQLLQRGKATMQTITVPAEQVIFHASQFANGFFTAVSSWHSLYRENLALRSQNNTLRGAMARYQGVAEENQVLKEQFEKLSPKTFNLLPAPVIGWGDFLTLGVGSYNGVAQGQVVVLGDYYIGRIATVTPRVARVKTIFHSEAKTPVLIRQSASVQSKQVRGIVTGAFGASLWVEQVSQNDKIVAGDVVLTAGEEGVAKGLVIGEIGEPVRDEAAIFQKAQVKPFVDLSTIQTVFVSIDK